MSSNPGLLGHERSATLKPPKPTSRFPEASKEPKPRRRTYSNSSASSAGSAVSYQSEEQFVLSPHQSPAPEIHPFFSSYQPISSLAPSNVRGSKQQCLDNPQNTHGLLANTSTSSTSTATPTSNNPTPRSRPITIELPQSLTRKINSNSVYTPVEPLSGRGDISGGYFPFHEDPKKRVHRPHPFHADKKEPKDAAPSHDPRVDGEPLVVPTRPSMSKASLSEQPPSHLPMNMAQMSHSRSHTPVTSYAPSGHSEAQLPLGKYYPSNYEASQRRSNQRTPTHRSSLRPPSSAGPSSVKSDTVVPQFNRTESSRIRSDSDAKRRLQQYQRDMVAQATLAARQITNIHGTPETLAAMHNVPMEKLHITPHRPLSPRLQPLGSPGPVTPMDLEGHGGSDGGYLMTGRPVPSPDAGRDNEAIAKAMAAEIERKRREGRGSPAVEAGGFGF